MKLSYNRLLFIHKAFALSAACLLLFSVLLGSLSADGFLVWVALGLAVAVLVADLIICRCPICSKHFENKYQFERCPRCKVWLKNKIRAVKKGN